MTKEQVIAMAREAGFFIGDSPEWDGVKGCFERFATLVGNAALEEARQIVKNHFDYTRSEAVEAINLLKEPTT